MNTFIIVGLAVCNVLNFPLYVYLFRTIFQKRGDFREAIKFYFRPDLVSAYRKEFVKDVNAEIKLLFFVGLCVLLNGAEFILLRAAFERWVSS